MPVLPGSSPPQDLFALIQRDCAGVIGRVAYAFAVGSADRDELFQDILVAIWQALPQFQQGAKLSTYVYRVAFNCAVNWKRSRSRYRRKLDDYASLVSDPGAGLSPRVRAQLEWLYMQLHTLAPLDRTLLLLFLDRIDYATIAEITGVSESNVGVRLHRIKQQLAAASEKVRHEL